MPVIGRERELALLLEHWRLARGGEGQVVQLAGEPGIGKSRLVLALRERLGKEPHTALQYQGSPLNTSSALRPVIEQMEHAAGFEWEDGPAERLAKLRDLLSMGETDPERALMLFASLLTLPPHEGHEVATMTPQQRKVLTFQALLAQLEGLSGRQPILMVLEDAHWLDPTTLELFEIVVERIGRLPVLLLVTFRPERKPSWTDRSNVTTLELDRLDCSQATAIVRNIADDRDLPEPMVARARGQLS